MCLSIQIEQQCEEWPVQRCTLEKKTVKKIHPDTACRKIPREVCVPNNCAMVQGEEICRDENRMLVQNVPQEECELQPEENCHAEAVHLFQLLLPSLPFLHEECAFLVLKLHKGTISQTL